MSDSHRRWDFELAGMPVSVKAWDPAEYSFCVDIELDLNVGKLALSLDLDQAQQLRDTLDLAVAFAAGSAPL